MTYSKDCININKISTFISPHPRKLDINRAVGTSRSRYRVFRRHRCRRFDVQEGLLLIQLFSQKKVQMKRSVTGDDADGIKCT